MSYAATAALQEAVYSVLSGDATITTLTDGNVYDALPPGPVPSLYVSLGPERVRDASDVMADAAIHDFPIIVTSDGTGFHEAKRVAAAVSDALLGGTFVMSQGAVTAMNFLRARARRVGNVREIEIWFRAMIDMGDV